MYRFESIYILKLINLLAFVIMNQMKNRMLIAGFSIYYMKKEAVSLCRNSFLLFSGGENGIRIVYDMPVFGAY